VSRGAYIQARKRKQKTGRFAYVRSDLLGGVESKHAKKRGRKRIWKPWEEQDIRRAACEEFEYKTEEEIAEYYGCDRSTIHRILHCYAVESGEQPCSIVKVCSPLSQFISCSPLTSCFPHQD
jgi:hypothetical protein